MKNADETNRARSPWGWCDHGVGEIVVYDTSTDDAICSLDDTDGSYAWPDDYSTSGEAKDNAKLIVRCVNYHERLIEMVQALSYDYHLATGGKHHVSAGALLAELAQTEEA